MNRHLFKGTVATLSLGLAVTAATIPAFAHGQYRGIRGTVAGVTGSDVQVKTASGTATAHLTASTHYTRVTSGSLADVQPGTFVDVQMASGSTTVTAILISPAKPAGAARTTSGTTKTVHRTHTGTAPTGTKPVKTRPVGAATHVMRGGKVVQLKNGQLTLQGRGTQTVTYTVAPTATVSKFVSGQAGDLKAGETVQIMTDASGNALGVLITGA